MEIKVAGQEDTNPDKRRWPPEDLRIRKKWKQIENGNLQSKQSKESKAQVSVSAKLQ